MDRAGRRTPAGRCAIIFIRMKRLSRSPKIHKAIVLLFLAAAALPAQGQDIIPFSEIKTGMKGVGKTVFRRES